MNDSRRDSMISAKTIDINVARRKTSMDTVVSSRPTTSGVDYVDPDAFIAVVLNLFNDLIINGFKDMEEFVVQSLDLKNEAARHALEEGMDNLYSKVQDDVDENLKCWERICRDHYFHNFPSNSPSIITNSKKTTRNAGKSYSKTSSEEDLQEQVLDSELISLRSQLVAAHREGAKMRRELNSLEKQFALRRQVLSDAKSLDESSDGDLLEEVIRSAYLLKDTMLKASSFQEKSCLRTRLQELRNSLAEQPLEDQISALKMPSHLEVGDTATINLLS